MTPLSRLMLSCQETARLLSDSMDCSLPFSAKIRLYLHLRICKVCLLYRQHLQLLRHLLRSDSAELIDAQETTPSSLSTEAKQRIKRAIDASHRRQDGSA